VCNLSLKSRMMGKKENFETTGNKPVISSPLKKTGTVADDLLLSSPNFRPAGEQNLTLDLKRLQQTQGSSQDHGSRPSGIPTARKSFGRRVSFAATAHVRLYEKGDSDKEEEGGSASADEGTEMDFRPFGKKKLGGSGIKGTIGSPMPAMAHSPLRPHTEEADDMMMMDLDSSLPSTPSAIHTRRSTSGLLLDGSPMAIEHSANVVGGRFSTVTNYSEGEASFDVEIKDAHSSSFTSYHSAGDDEAIAGGANGSASNGTQAVDTDTMDFTRCVGGILNTQVTTTTTTVPADDNTMDFTVCVGGLIRRLPSVRLSDVSAVSSVDTMELTECVGQILSRQQLQQQQKDGHMSASSADDVDMEMTAVLPNRATLLSRTTSASVSASLDRLGSPSPFLVGTPLRLSTNSASTGNPASMTFIGDVGEPDAFRLLASMSPSVAPCKDQHDEHNDDYMDCEEQPQKQSCSERILFNSLIDTAKCSSDDEERESRNPHVKNYFPTSLSVLGTPRGTALRQGPSTSMSMHASSRASASVLSSLHASAHSLSLALPPPASPNPAPAIALTDFLNETGIRFLENISSLKRRETTGRPRDSDIVAPARQAFLAAALAPQLSFYEQVYLEYEYCHDLKYCRQQRN